MSDNGSVDLAKFLAEELSFVQKQRVRYGNRLDALDRGSDETDVRTALWLEDQHFLLEQKEKDIKEMLRLETENIPIVRAGQSVKGVGPNNLPRVIALIDINKAPTVSSLWKYAGYGVTDGEGDRLRKGVQASFNPALKTAVYVVVSGLMRAKGPYYDEYLLAREYYEVNRPDWTDLHKDLASKRKVAKLWLSHLWEVWRKLEGMPVREAYVFSHLDHTHKKNPENYGW